MPNPLTSIIIPVYNTEAFLEETLASVLVQTYTNWECIIVNDGSTDNSLAIAKKWEKKDNRFKVFSKENAGASAARNYGIDLANGEYIAFLDSDDVWMPQHLQYSVKDILTHQVDLSYSRDFFIINNIKTEQLNRSFPIETGIINLKKGIKSFLRANPISTPTVVCKKNKLVESGKFSFHKNAEDLHLWLKLLLDGCTFFSSNEVTTYVRIHSQSTSNEDRYCTKELPEVIHDLKDKIIEKHINYNYYFTYWSRRYFLLKDDKKHYENAIIYINSIEKNYFSIWKNIAHFFPKKLIKLISLSLFKLYAK